jgi:membrane-anchored glycerophosphoryl diester phosphodiesterase (GDPDase)
VSDRPWPAPNGADDERGWTAPDGAGPATPPAQPAATPQQGPAWGATPPPLPPGPPPGGTGFAPGGPGVPPGAWAPPPKPGLLPLRPLSFGTLLWAPFRTLRRNPAATFGSGLIVQLASALIAAGVVVPVFFLVFSRTTQAEPGQEDAILTGSIALLLLSMLVPIAVSIVAGAFLQGVMVVEVATGTLGERLSFAALWRRAARRIWPLIAWTAMVTGALTLLVLLAVAVIVAAVVIGDPIAVVVTVLLVIVGALGVAVLAAWLGTKLALVPSVIVLEGAGVGAAMRRSWALTNGYFWRTLGTLLLVGAILSFASQVVVQPISLIGSILAVVIDPTGTGAALGITIATTAITFLLSLVVGAITTVVQAALIAVIYVDLRMRKEGLDLDLQRTVEAREAGVATRDPYATAGEQYAATQAPS